MSKLLRWLFGRQYRLEADFYVPASGESEWRHLTELFRWGGIFNKPKEGKVSLGLYRVHLKPLVTTEGTRWDLSQIFKHGVKDPVFYADNISVTGD